MLPQQLKQKVESALSTSQNGLVHIESITPSGGGCINLAAKLETNKGTFFIKWNNASAYPGMFETESKGLTLLKQTDTLHMPDVVQHDVAGDLQFLILTFTKSADEHKNFWEKLGESLAALHRHRHSSFGLDHDNYIGSLVQVNQRSENWIEFFIDQRLESQLFLAEKQGSIPGDLRRRFEKLYSKLPEFLITESPSLLHGDLWRGNVMTNENGEPSIFDPAVYFGHREIDIAMTKLFGGFPVEFYEAYKNAFPLEPGYEERLKIYNLYPLLVHVNLFGGSYLQQVQSVLKYFS